MHNYIEKVRSGYNTLLFGLIAGDLYSTCLIVSFTHYPALNTVVSTAIFAKRGGSLYHLYDGLWYDPPWGLTHGLPHERWDILYTTGPFRKTASGQCVCG